MTTVDWKNNIVYKNIIINVYELQTSLKSKRIGVRFADQVHRNDTFVTNKI